MAEKTSKVMFEKLRDITSAAGTAHDAQGRPLSSDTYLEVLEMIDVDFDEQGKPSRLRIVVGPELYERFRVIGPQ